MDHFTALLEDVLSVASQPQKLPCPIIKSVINDKMEYILWIDRTCYDLECQGYSKREIIGALSKVIESSNESKPFQYLDKCTKDARQHLGLSEQDITLILATKLHVLSIEDHI